MIKFLNETVWCKIAPSAIHGIGIFAIRDVPQGTKIWTMTGEVFEAEDFTGFVEEVKNLICDYHTFSDKFKMRFFSPNDFFVPMAFMNHSETPNSKEYLALRDIKKGEEITEDYEDNAGYGLSGWQKEYYKFMR